MLSMLSITHISPQILFLLNQRTYHSTLNLMSLIDVEKSLMLRHLLPRPVVLRPVACGLTELRDHLLVLRGMVTVSASVMTPDVDLVDLLGLRNISHHGHAP